MKRDLTLTTMLAVSDLPIAARIRKMPSFTIGEAGVKMAQELSMLPHQEWFPHALAPFQEFVLEWAPSWYVAGQPDQFVREGAIYKDGQISFYALGADGVIFQLPFESYESHYSGEEHGAIVPEMFIDLLWGPGLIDRHGTRPDFEVHIPRDMVKRIGRDQQDLFNDRLQRAYRELAGTIRVFYAQLALLNLERPAVYEQKPSGRAYISPKVGFRPVYNTSTVTIRPNAIQKIAEYVRDGATGEARAYHQVREHWVSRAYQPNENWEQYYSEKYQAVRWRRTRASHWRGDKDKGVIEKKVYVVGDK